MKISKYLLPFTLFVFLVSCNAKEAKDQQTCSLYNADKIDAIEALERLGLQPNKNGQRFEPVETTCASFKNSPWKGEKPFFRARQIPLPQADGLEQNEGDNDDRPSFT